MYIIIFLFKIIEVFYCLIIPKRGIKEAGKGVISQLLLQATTPRLLSYNWRSSLPIRLLPGSGMMNPTGPSFYLASLPVQRNG